MIRTALFAAAMIASAPTFAQNLPSPRVNILTPNTIAGGALSGTDATSGTVRPPSGTVSRTLGQIAGERVNPLAFGADASGVSDSGAAFNAARTSIQTAGGTVWISPGTYLLATGVFTVPRVSYAFDGGTTLTGSYTLPGQNDAIVGNIGQGFTKYSTEAGGAFGLYSSMFVDPPSSSVSAYQKAAVYGRIKTAYGPAGNGALDTVGAQFTASTFSTVPLARLWAMDGLCEVGLDATADAHVSCVELGINNKGQAQPLLDQQNTKLGFTAFAAGTSNSTSAFTVDTSGAAWEYGVAIKDTAVNTWAFALLHNNGSAWVPTASIDKTGNASLQAITSATFPVARFVTRPTTSTSGCAVGDVAVNSTGAYLNVCIAANTWKSAALGAFVQ
jgi:hypothetical protein